MTARRDFFAFTAGAVAARTVLPLAAKAKVRHRAAPYVNPDAVLLANAAEAKRLDEQSFALTIDLEHNDPTREESYATARDMMAAYHDFTAAICMTPAETVQGLLAKAELARGTILLGPNDEPDPDDRLVWSVLTDLERMFGGRTVA